MIADVRWRQPEGSPSGSRDAMEWRYDAGMDVASQTRSAAQSDPPGGERYLLLADITGYTGFMTTELGGGDEAYLKDVSERVDKILAGT